MTTSAIRHWKSLVSKGYFPEELPPCFTSEDLEEFVSDVNFNIHQYSSSKWMKLLTFSIPRVRGARRMLSIPNAYYYVKLAYEISENLAEIRIALAKSSISAFKLVEPSDRHLRYIEKPNFDKFKEDRILRSVGSRFLLIIDINRFYQSIYTHSIVWALHSKVIAKEIARDKQRQRSFLGSRLDSISTCLQDGQTIGIPIGPDTSRLLSELILSAVDSEIQLELPDIKGVRNVDDYYLYFKSMGDLEIGRSVIQKALKNYELELNGIKDTVIELPEGLQREWFTTISEFEFKGDPAGQKKELISFFDQCFHFARLNPDDNIISYSIAKLNGLTVDVDNWNLFQACLLNSLTLESKAVSHVVYQLRRYAIASYRLDYTTVYGALESFIMYHAELDHHFEISWSLWYFAESSLQLSEKLTKRLNLLDHPLLILQVLDLDGKGLLPIELDKARWNDLIVDDGLYGQNWLLAYEAMAHGWLDSSNLNADAFFAKLASKGVRFFKPDQDIGDAPIAYGGRGSLDSHSRRRSSVADLVNEEDDNGSSENDSEDLPF